MKPRIKTLTPWLLLAPLLLFLSYGPANSAISTGGGNTFGATSAADKAIPRFNGTSGKLLQDSSVLIDDTNAFDMPVLGSTPANPAASRRKLYWKGTTLYGLSSAGTETAIGGAAFSGLTAGQILYADSSTSATGKNAFYFDATNNRLGIGTAGSGAVNDKIEVRIADATSGGLSITTPTYTTGFGVNLGTSGEGYLFHNGAKPIYFMTSATIRGALTAAGQWNLGSSADPGAIKVLVTNATATDVALAVKGATSQSAHLQDWKNSSDSVLSYVDSAGGASFASLITGTPITSAYGGTGNGFSKFTGPSTSEKTFTLPNANATILTDNAAVTVAQGGTGSTSLTAHYVPVGNGTSAVTMVSPSTAGYVLTSNGTGSDPSFQAVSGGVIPGNCNLRLTLVSGTAVMTSDQTAKTAIYATPYNGNNCSFYNGSSAWTSLSFSETTLSLSGLTSNTNYDVFGYNNSGTMAVEALSWSSSSARATALVLQDGVWVKSGATTRRYLGSFRTTNTTGQTEFSGFTGTPAAGGTEAKLFLFNAQNRVRFTAYSRDSTDSWTHAATWRNADNSATMRVSYITGLPEQDLNASYSCLAAGGTTTAVGVGVNSSSNYTGDSGVEGAYTTTLRGTWRGQSAIGLNYVQALEYSSGTGTFYGDAGGSATQNALIFTGDF